MARVGRAVWGPGALAMVAILAFCGNQQSSGQDAGEQDAGSCVPEQCASGACLSPTQCAPPCSDTAPCAGGLECCQQRCVDIKKDFKNCGGCGNACADNQFCSGTNCADISINNVVSNPQITIVKDGESYDDAAADELYKAFIKVSPYQANPGLVREVLQSEPGIFDAGSGKPLVGPGNIMVLPGGAWKQPVIGYLNNSSLSAVYVTSTYEGTEATYYFKNRATGNTIAQAMEKEISPASQQRVVPNYDYFLLEVVLDPASGTLCLLSYGLMGAGTQTAAYYFGDQVLAHLGDYSDRWYVYKWTDQDDDHSPSSADLFEKIASGIY